MNPNEQIRELRKQTGLNRREFAEHFGIPLRTVEEWEAGRRKPPEYIPRLMEYQLLYEKNYTQSSRDDKDELFSKGDFKMTVICFHNPNEENGYLSNWYLSPFHMEGITFSSMEQFMMYKKAITFHDTAIAMQILATNDVSEIKRLGRLVSQYDDNYWSGIRQIVVYDGLIAKFSQNEDLKKLLIGTGKGILAECAVRDRIWGIGLSMTDPERFERSKWRGQNLLGYTLMLVRDRI